MTTSSPAGLSLLFQSKAPGETVQLPFPFQDVMQFGETIASTSFGCVVETGVDASPSSMLSVLSPGVAKTTVNVTVTAGVSGVVYRISGKVVGSSGATYQKAGLLAVIDPVMQ